MNGKIIKGIAGFYYVHTPLGLVECKAKGVFRKEGIKPLVGDNVKIEIISKEEKTGNITSILERQNALIRPSSANIDQAMIIFAITKPAPNYNLLDRFLISMQQQDIPTVVCFNKLDIAEDDDVTLLKNAYEGCGCKVIFVSGKMEKGLNDIKKVLKGKTTVIAGPSGVGKSTIVNALYPQANMETGEISRKIERGKHTTRHAELFALSDDTFIMDTPGFTSLWLSGIEKEELGEYYPEFAKYEENCKFIGCAHISEPVCGVKEAVDNGDINRIRYDNYCTLYKELKDNQKY
ncbi:MAG: ribosome small subunit-dependent GTPase A [Lachnospiraceae bacterium]|nr:ribosome small subunit-dependent GTPase A [Lachnospiraceae bacterium]